MSCFTLDPAIFLLPSPQHAADVTAATLLRWCQKLLRLSAAPICHAFLRTFFLFNLSFITESLMNVTLRHTVTSFFFFMFYFILPSFPFIINVVKMIL